MFTTKFIKTTLAVILLTAAGAAGETNMREITDMAGRTVRVPTEIKKVFSVNPIGTIFVYTLSPATLAGWNYPLPPDAEKWILPNCRKLPVLGHLYGRNTNANPETILKTNPDILISMGPLSETTVSAAEKIQRQFNIPVVVIDGQLDRISEAYLFAGDLLNEKVRAKELADYCHNALIKANDRLKKIPIDKRIRVYYAEGPNGLLTDGKDSPQMEILELAGGSNVAEFSSKRGFGRTEVSFEQLLCWNPEVILVGYSGGHRGGLYESILKDGKWRQLSAVKNHRVFNIPQIPFNWFDRPPSVNRILGIVWLTHILHGESAKIDIVSEVKTFHDKFYHYRQTDKDAKMLINF
jgi:iron complex transport system substrate-binding protein